MVPGGTFHAAGEALSHCFVKLFWGHPATQLADSSTNGCGHCVFLFLGHNHGLALDTSDIPRVSPGQPAGVKENLCRTCLDNTSSDLRSHFCKTTTGKCLWSNWFIRLPNPFRWLVCLNAHWHPAGAWSKQLLYLRQCHCNLWTKSSLRCDRLNCNSNTCCSGSDKTTTLHKLLFASPTRRQNTTFPPQK